MTFNYEICNVDCDVCDVGTVSIQVDKAADSTVDPVYICPDCEDGNSFDPIPCLPECKPQNSIVIVNRWGEIVFRADPFEGKWTGVNNRNQPLPAGTYFFILRLDLGQGEILVGEIVLLR